MNTNWQYCALMQAMELKKLGLAQIAASIWVCNISKNDAHIVDAKSAPSNSIYTGVVETYSAFNLAEIAVMLGYSFTPSNVIEAAEKLINEIKVGNSTLKDCEARLQDIQSEVQGA